MSSRTSRSERFCWRSSELKNSHGQNFTTAHKFVRNGGYITDEALAEFQWVQDNDAAFHEYFTRYKNKLFNNWYLLGHERFAHVIDFANLVEEFDAVLRRIGIEPVRKLPKVNPTKGKKSFAEYYPPATWEQAFRCYGPFMRKWDFSFPDEWGTPRIPLSATVRFHAIDRGVRTLTRFTNLSTNSGLVQRTKRLLQGG